LIGAATAALVVALSILPRVFPLGPGSASGSVPTGGRVELRIDVPDGAHTGSADADSVWLGVERTGQVLRLDAVTGAFLGDVTVNQPTSDPYELWPASDGTFVWASGRDDRSLVRIDRGSMSVTARWAIDAVPYRVLPAGGAVWISDFDGGRVLEINAEDGTILGTISIPRATGLALAGSRLWVADYVGDLYEVNAAAHSVIARHDIASQATDLLVAGNNVYVWGLGGRRLDRFDAAAGAVAASRSGITAVANLRGDLWGAMDVGALARLDGANLAPLAAVPLGAVTTDQLVASADQLWAYAQAGDRTYIDAVRPTP
jgi:hypothetical protein